MPNWVLATVELPEDKIGFVINDENNWFFQENGYGGGHYDQEYNDNGTRIYTEMWTNCSLSLINTTYITSKKSSDDYHVDGGFKSRVPTTPVYNDNGHITFGIKLVDNDKLIKGSIPLDYDGEWTYVDIGYDTQNVDDNYVKFECDFKWSGIINEQVLNDILAFNLSDEGMGDPIKFGSWYAIVTHTTDDLVNYTSGTHFIWDFYENDVHDDLTGTENVYILMKDYNETFKFVDDGIDVSSMFFYNRYEDKWYFYFMWIDYNGNNYYYDATDCFINKTWLHVEYSRNGTEGTLKFGDRTYTFLVKKGDLNLRFYSYLMPVNKSEDLNETGYTYTIYGYTQIANIKSYVVPLEEELDFETPYVHVRNSNYRDNFFLSVEVENYDPNGYEVLWDTGARTVSIPCRLGEYHEVTVTNRAGSTKAWNVAGFGDARFYSYRVDICRDAIPLSDVGNIIRNIDYNIINDTEYADNCTITYHADVDSIIVNDGSSIYIDKTEDAICPLREKGYYTIIVSRYDQYASSANGVGFALSWKMKVEGDIGEWLNSSITRTYYTSALDLSSDCYGYLFCFDGYGRTGIHLSLKISHGKVYVVAKSVAQTEKWCILPTEFANGEWVECMVYMYEQNKFFFTVNGYTLLDFSENVNPESVFLFNAVMAGSSALLQNIKTPYVNIKDIKRSMQLRKDR